jgi:hypothetical protein
MDSFANRIRPHVDAELAAAERDPVHGFRNLERAHVLGQASTREHVRVHWRMLGWAWRRREVGAVLGQAFRLTGAALLTFIGMVPHGNTGGSNVSAFRRMTIDPELEAIIKQARRS